MHVHYSRTQTLLTILVILEESMLVITSYGVPANDLEGLAQFRQKDPLLMPGRPAGADLRQLRFFYSKLSLDVFD